MERHPSKSYLAEIKLLQKEKAAAFMEIERLNLELSKERNFLKASSISGNQDPKTFGNSIFNLAKKLITIPFSFAFAECFVEGNTVTCTRHYARHKKRTFVMKPGTMHQMQDISANDGTIPAVIYHSRRKFLVANNEDQCNRLFPGAKQVGKWEPSKSIFVAKTYYGKGPDRRIIIISFQGTQENMFHSDLVPILKSLVQGLTIPLGNYCKAMQAKVDYLTGLLTRSVFEQKGEEECKRAYRGHALCLVYLDLDNFKAINDTHGHHIGDAVIRSVATCLKHHRAFDFAGRLGGEEFAVILPETGTKGALVYAQRALDAIRKLRIKTRNGSMLKITASIGIAAYDHKNYMDWNAFLATADRAHYQAKEEGKNRIVMDGRTYGHKRTKK